MFNVNVRGPYFQLQSLLPLLGNPSSVVFTSSLAGSIAVATASIYSATKAAVISLGRTLAVELAQRGVRVNVLSPGPIDTSNIKKTGFSPDQQKSVSGRACCQVAPEAVGDIRRSGPGCNIPTLGGFEQHHRHGADHRRRPSTELTVSELPTEWRNERLVAK